MFDVVTKPVSLHGIEVGAIIHLRMAGGWNELVKCEVIEKIPPLVRVRVLAAFDKGGRVAIRAHSSVPEAGKLLNVNVKYISLPA